MLFTANSFIIAYIYQEKGIERDRSRWRTASNRHCKLIDLIRLLNRYQFSRHLAASVDNALHTLQATADYWNCAVVCCYKTFQCNQKYHS